MKIEVIEVVEKSHILKQEEIVPCSTIRVDGEPLLSGDRAPLGCEYIFVEQEGGWFKQCVRRVPPEPIRIPPMDENGFYKHDPDGSQDKQLTLGQLIDLLKPHAGKVESDLFPDDDSERTISFWGDVIPKVNLDSYRGIYTHLAIGYHIDGDNNLSATEFLSGLKNTVGKNIISYFEGFKGEDHYMDLDTPIWAANYGNSNGFPIIGINVTNWNVELLVGRSEK